MTIPLLKSFTKQSLFWQQKLTNNVKISDEELYGYTNQGMDTPTTPGDCIPGLFQAMDSLNPGLDSDFDESLAIPEQFSDEKIKEETDASSMYSVNKSTCSNTAL